MSIFQFLIEVFLIFILPIVLLLTGIVPNRRKYRFGLFAGSFVLSIALIWLHGFSYEEIGISANILDGIVPYTISAFVMGMSLILLARQLHRRRIAFGEDAHFYYGIFIILSLVQVALFQCFLLNRAVTVFPPAFSILLGSLIFSFLHSLFDERRLHLGLSFLAGLILNTLFLTYHNLYLAVLCHSILNAIAVRYSFFTRIK